jgi:colicin import membrane protein|tara:strand:- start:1236 stop:2564 length:1329 start_codon:yes stop_codon:yes gene_type:complete
MSRDLLREAIADAKAVRESAIANAKAALEEAFTPHLKNVLAEKIKELDEEEDMKEGYHEKKKEMEEGYHDKMEEGAHDKMEEGAHDKDKMEEGHMSSPVMRKGLRGDDAAELETEKMRMMEKGDEMKEGKHEVEEGKHEVEEGKHEVEEGKHEVEEGKHEVEEELSLEELLSEEAHEEEEVDADETEETEIDLDDLTEEDLTKFVEEVIKDMVEAGELEAGEAAEEVSEMAHGDKMEEGYHDKMEEGAHDKMEEGYHDKMEEGAHDKMEEGMHKDKMEEELSDADVKKVDKEVDAVRDDLDQIAKLAKDAGEDAEDIKDVIDEDVNEELAEAYKVINKLRRDINEVNLLNSKLLYTNKIFRNKNLNESQKVKVLNSFDKAETVKEVKLVFESLSTAFDAKKSNIKESMGFASKPTGKAPINESAPVVQEDAMVARFKKLAGL